MRKFMRNTYLWVAFIVFSGLPSSTAFSFQASSGEGVISYEDWTSLLRQTVFDVGMPDRASLSRPVPPAGSSIYKGSKKATRAEANRLFYHLITESGVKALGQMRQSLQATASDPVFQQISGDEQLALWLNLRNIAVIELVASKYPMKNAQRFIEKRMDEKWLRVGGNLWSIQDIETYVIATWKDPLVIYGFHRGHIGSPNIRRKAFTGPSVWDDLKDNAREFTSSLRGIQFKKNKAKVSNFYKSVARAFPDFETDLKAHIAEYAVPFLVPKIMEAKGFSPTIKDGTVADLYEGATSTIQVFSDNAAAGLTLGNQFQAFISGRTTDGRSMNLPFHVSQFLRTVVARKTKGSAEGSVEIESLDRSDPEPSAKEEPEGDQPRL